jgi:hypothetical protein
VIYTGLTEGDGLVISNSKGSFFRGDFVGTFGTVALLELAAEMGDVFLMGTVEPSSLVDFFGLGVDRVGVLADGDLELGLQRLL